MPSEAKQRKKSPKVREEAPEALSGGTEPEPEPGGKPRRPASPLDLKSLACLLSLAACGALSWVVLQHGERLSQMEQQHQSLQGRASRLLDMEEEIARVSRQLAASEDDLQEALSAVSMATRLRQDVSDLHAAVATVRTDESSASRDLQAVNARFLNVTETWRRRLAAVASELTALQAESRDGHAAAAQRVNEAERRARALAERLEELEDSTRRNARALERTEEEDAQRVREQLDWNAEQIRRLDQRLAGLGPARAELDRRLREAEPRARECEEMLPRVEEAVRSVLRLGGELSGAERRLEELVLQVMAAEDGMLKLLNHILPLRRRLDALQAPRRAAAPP